MRRGRLAVLALVVLLVAGGAVFALTRAGGPDAPVDRAAKLVPADALLYLHLSTDRERTPDARLARLVGSFPTIAGFRDRFLGAVSGVPGGFDISRDVRPWLGKEVGFALLDTTERRANSLILLSVANKVGAKRFLDRVANAQGIAPYHGVAVKKFGPVAAAFVGSFLALGQDAAVHAAIDRGSAKPLPALATAKPYLRATRGRPDDRSLDVYLPVDGVRRVLRPASGALSLLGATLDDPQLVGVGMSLSAREPGMRVWLRKARSKGAPAEFSPSLLGTVPREAAGYAGLAGLGALGAVLRNVTGSEVTVPFERALRGASLNLQRDVLAPLRGEVALSVTPALPVPIVTLVAKTSNEKKTREALARLQAPLAELLASPAQSGAPAPAFQQRNLGNVAAYALAVTPGLELTYAVTGGRLIVSSQANGVGRVLAKRQSLEGDKRLENVLTDLPDKAEAVLFLDLGQLLALAEQAGLTGDSSLGTARDDLRRVRALGAVVRRDETDSTAEFLLDIP